MDDNDIIKGLENWLMKDIIVTWCNGKDNNLMPVTVKDILKVINNLKAEIEQYKARISNDIEYIERIEVENRKQKAELERLERHTEMYHEVRAEAVKEFWSKLKQGGDILPGWSLVCCGLGCLNLFALRF